MLILLITCYLADVVIRFITNPAFKLGPFEPVGSELATTDVTDLFSNIIFCNLKTLSTVYLIYFFTRINVIG